MGASKTNEREAEQNVRCYPAPVIVPAVEHGQDNAEPDPVERDRPGPRVTYQEEERWSRQAPENAPPFVVVDEEIANMVNGDQDDCEGLEPISVVDRIADVWFPGKFSCRTLRVVHGAEPCARGWRPLRSMAALLLLGQ